jgi:hypothetical protein
LLVIQRRFRNELTPMRPREPATRKTVKIIREKVIMPNSKQLRYCLGREVAALGDGFARTAERVPAHQMVACRLVEAEHERS